ncbi:MAG TPA: epoxide hydrolase N-terminal domain-containing protein, partial [Acidimicrobiia bacterium]|nr:epoxide hydrolase N-terminal domain-containing protein [Acidimicrobiia bacterium]
MPQSFTIAISDDQLDDLRRRLRDVRLGPPPANEPWQSGVDYSFLGEMIDYWAHRFDWRERERWLNSFPHYLAYVIGMLFVRASHRADRVYRAMQCRGFSGRFYSLAEFSASPANWIFLCAMTGAAAGIIGLEWIY